MSQQLDIQLLLNSILHFVATEDHEVIATVEDRLTKVRLLHFVATNFCSSFHYYFKNNNKKILTYLLKHLLQRGS